MHCIFPIPLVSTRHDNDAPYDERGDFADLVQVKDSAGPLIPELLQQDALLQPVAGVVQHHEIERVIWHHQSPQLPGGGPADGSVIRC